MSEIWNLSALCRCCHSDGQFKSLQTAIVVDGEAKIYSTILQETLDIIILQPPGEASYTICDDCIKKLQDAYHFKKQVLLCEQKFDEYCKNEQLFTTASENIKVEIDAFVDDDDRDDTSLVDMKDEILDRKDTIDKLKLKNEEFKVEIKDTNKKIKCEDGTLTNAVEISIDVKIPVKSTSKKKKTSKGPKKYVKRFYDSSYEILVKTEDGEVYSCKTCGGRYEDIKALKKHVREIHCISMYNCDQCDAKFTKLSEKYKHRDTHKQASYACEYCGKVASNQKSYKSHINTHYKTKSFQCDICQKTFYYKKSLLIHLGLHYGTKKKFFCHICGHGFNDKTNMNKHIGTVHEKLRPFPCDLCDKSFTAKKHLIVHIRKHTGERPYVCDKCSKSFITRSELNRHVCDQDKEPTKSFRCKQCDSTFRTRGELLKHIRQHSGRKPLLCTICNKDFSCKYSLKRHIFEHSGQKPHACDFCDAKFSQKSLLKRHKQRRHTPGVVLDKKKCEICKKYVANLEIHIERHNNRPFGCQYCEKRYTERTALNRHVANIHFGRKAHACDMCEKKYRQAKTLRAHKMKVHKMVAKTEEEENFDSILTKYTLSKSKKRKLTDGYLYIEDEDGSQPSSV